MKSLAILLALAPLASARSWSRESSGYCVPEGVDAVPRWSQENDGAFWTNGCTNGSDGSAPWTMLSAYRDGGFKWVHWFPVVEKDSHYCIRNWYYYKEDGKTLVYKHRIPTALPYTGTTEKEMVFKYWCPVSKFRSGGVQGKQWEYCVNCRGDFAPNAGTKTHTPPRRP